MKTTVRERYWSNGNLYYRIHETDTNKLHGLYERYYKDCSIDCLRYYNNGYRIKLENNYWMSINKIYIRYYL